MKIFYRMLLLLAALSVSLMIALGKGDVTKAGANEFLEGGHAPRSAFGFWHAERKTSFRPTGKSRLFHGDL